MQIFINGNFVKDDEAAVSPLSGGFMYGYGVFETIKVHFKAPVFFEEHWHRLKEALEFLGLDMDFSQAELFDACEKLAFKNSIENGFIKIMCSRSSNGGTDIVASAGSRTYSGRHEAGFGICAAGSRRNETSRLCRVKSMNYAENLIQREEAARLGFDEAVFANTRGDVCEGCMSNIFWIKGGSLFTPSVECGILPGIAREKTIQLCKKLGIEVLEGRFRFSELQSADEIFMTNSLMDIMPVKMFEDRRFDVAGLELTARLMDAYKKYYYCK